MNYKSYFKVLPLLALMAYGLQTSAAASEVSLSYEQFLEKLKQRLLPLVEDRTDKKILSTYVEMNPKVPLFVDLTEDRMWLVGVACVPLVGTSLGEVIKGITNSFNSVSESVSKDVGGDFKSLSHYTIRLAGYELPLNEEALKLGLLNGDMEVTFYRYPPDLSLRLYRVLEYYDPCE